MIFGSIVVFTSPGFEKPDDVGDLKRNFVRENKSSDKLNEQLECNIRNRFYRKARGCEKWLEKPDGTADLNNRSLALRKTLGLTKSEWELS